MYWVYTDPQQSSLYQNNYYNASIFLQNILQKYILTLLTFPKIQWQKRLKPHIISSKMIHTLQNTLLINMEIIMPIAIQNIIKPIILHMQPPRRKELLYIICTICISDYLSSFEILSIASSTAPSVVTVLFLPVKRSIRSGTMSITFVTVS